MDREKIRFKIICTDVTSVLWGYKLLVACEIPSPQSCIIHSYCYSVFLSRLEQSRRWTGWEGEGLARATAPGPAP